VSKLNHYFLIAFLIFSFRIFSQELLFEKPYNLTNLPSNECYNVIQDKKGYIWFSTDAGLCKYDGNKVKVFSKKEGLPEESCYGIAMNSKGVIYIISSSNRVLQLKDDSLHELAFTKSFQKEMGNSINFATDFKIFNDSLLIVNSQVKTYKININTNQFINLASEKLKHAFNIIGNNVYSIKPLIDVNAYRNKKENYTNLIINYTDTAFETKFYDSLNVKRTIYRIKCCVYKETLFIAFGTALIKIRKNGKTESIRLKDDILSMEINKEGTLFVGLQNIGLLSFPNTANLEDNEFWLLKNFSVTGIQLDARGGIWCSTLENGITYCENPFISKTNNIKYKNIKSNVFKKIDSSLWLSDIKGDVWKTDGEIFTYYHLPIENKQLTNEILKLNKNYILATDQGLFRYNVDFNKGEQIHLSKLNSVFTAKNLLQFGSKVFGVKSTSLFEIKNNIIIERIMNFNSKASSIVTNNKQLFVAKEEGLFVIDTTNYSLSLYYPLKLIKKVAFHPDSKENNLFLALTKDGFFVIDNFKKYSFDFNNKENIRLNDFFLDNNRVWLATNIGVIEIPNIKDKSFIIYNSFYGLPNKEFFKIAVVNNNVVVASDEEVFVFKNKWNSARSFYSKPKIKNIFLNEILADSSLLNNIPFYKNQFKFIFENLNYENESYELKYILTGTRNDSGVIYNNELKLVDLTPGKYELSIFDLKPLEQKYSQAISIKFEIQKPFWQKLWFYLLIITIVILVIYFGVRLYLKKLRAKDAKESEITNLINNYQMAAIRAQMNPHFIFNCINSIQRYVLTNDKTTAYNYLTKFSKLIRLVLNNSEEEIISLKDELEMVSLYIQLEQLRFEDSFIFELIVSNDLDTDSYLIPPMMLQPYIENSIWHGIMLLNNSRKGKISIFVSENNDMLVIEIIDNGVGREEAMKHSSKTHKSKANKLNERRIDIINAINHSINGSIKITDVLNDNDQSVIGTKVTLLIPQSYE